MMKRICVLLLICLLALPACFDDDTTKPKDDNGDGPETSPYSGTFIIADTLDSNTCQVPAPLGAVANVVVVGDSINFAGFAGVWDSLAAAGSGTTPETTVPVDPPDCYAYYTVTFSVTFTDTDHFHGTYGASYRKDPGCPNPDPCSYTYRIGGTRP